MKEKLVIYGTKHKVVVLSADYDMIICHAHEINEGFALLFHGKKIIPKEGDTGEIEFVRDGKRGHWEFTPKTEPTK